MVHNSQTTPIDAICQSRSGGRAKWRKCEAAEQRNRALLNKLSEKLGLGKKGSSALTGFLPLRFISLSDLKSSERHHEKPADGQP